MDGVRPSFLRHGPWILPFENRVPRRWLITYLAVNCRLVVDLVVVSALELVGGFLLSVVLWAFLMNTGGSAGDLFIAAKVMGYPSTTYFQDTSEGFIVYGPTNVDESRQ